MFENTPHTAGDRLRVTANLIQAFPEKHLWADAYQRDLRDVLAMQAEIATKISHWESAVEFDQLVIDLKNESQKRKQEEHDRKQEQHK